MTELGPHWAPRDTLIWPVPPTRSSSLSCSCRFHPQTPKHQALESPVLIREPEHRAGVGRTEAFTEPWLAPRATRVLLLWPPANVLQPSEECWLDRGVPGALSLDKLESGARGKLYFLFREQDSAHRSRQSGDFTRLPTPPPTHGQTHGRDWHTVEPCPAPCCWPVTLQESPRLPGEADC